MTGQAHARTADLVFSHEAAKRASKNVGKSHDIVFHILATSPLPLTNEEIEDRSRSITNLSRSRIRSAVAELRRQGEVQYAAITREDPSHPVGHHILARFNDHFLECSTCDVEHWWRRVAGDLWRDELIGPCGNSRDVNFYEEGD